jgi:outer membrane protein insertion porin family
MSIKTNRAHFYFRHSCQADRIGGPRFGVGIILIVLFGCFLGFTELSEAQESGLRVVKVSIEGTQAVSTGTILNRVRSRTGSVFNEKTVAEDARRILIMPQIADVTWDVTQTEGQVHITFRVIETPQIASVEFLGNKNVKVKDLSKEIEFDAGDFMDRYLVQVGATALEELYHKKGYYFAKVSVNESALQDDLKVIYVIVEGPKLRIKKRRFIGNDSLPTRKLKGKVKTSAYFPIFQKGRLEDEQLEQDKAALQSYYREEGFLDARVFYEVKMNEDKTRAEVNFIIEEGPQYKVAALRFDGDEKLSKTQLLEALKLEPGKVYTRERQIIAQRAVKRAYGKEGYIYANVQLEPEYTDQAGQVNAVFRIRENKKYYLGRLIIRGNHETQDKVVRRAFDHFEFTPGGIYDTDAMEKGRKRLLGGGFFESLSVLPIGNDPNYRDALAEVREARTGLILFGVGVDTNSGVLGQFSIEQQNFDIAKYPRTMRELFSGDAFTGGGQRMKLSFSPGTRVTTGYINFFEPYLFDQPYYLDTTLMLYRRWREAYLEQRRGGRVTLGHRFTRDWSVEATVRAENVEVSDLNKGNVIQYDANGDPIPDPDGKDGILRKWQVNVPMDVQDVEGNNFLTSLKAGIACNKTDSLYRPSEGYKINFGWEQVGAMGGDFDFATLSAGFTNYETVYMDITERKTVWATGIRGSRIIGDAPLFERFYAGGIGSMRGFDYRGVSPHDTLRGASRDYTIGSDWLLLAGTELTHPLYEEVVYGKLFCDSGIVDEGPYRVAVGFGLELVIPQLFQMIPMHFDFGFPVYSDDQDDEEVFSFSFGMTF